MRPTAVLLLALACTPDDADDTGADDTSDTGDTGADSDTGDTTADSDSADTGDTGTDSDSADSDSADTGADSDSADTGADSDSADTGDTGPLDGLSVALVADGLVNPVGIVAPPGDPRLFLVEKRGTVRVVGADGALEPGFFVDLRGQVDTGNAEQGLLGLAFHPQFGTNRLAYLNFTDTSGDTVIAEVEVDGDAADTGTWRVVLQVDQPYDNHNGGDLAFGPDGMLYIGLGDGGSGGDPQDRAQNTGVLLGKMLRIDPLGGDSTDNVPAYGIPDDNPWADNTTGIRKEIWSYGLRNPWRYSFDRQTGDLWIADVGQDAWEEVDFQPASSAGGENWGWNACEGFHVYDPPPVGAPVDCDLAGSSLPVHEYPQTQGCSVTGGYVYRGTAIPWLQGRYVYADYCEGWVRSFARDGAAATDHDDHTADLRDGQFGKFGWISTFGQDADGELYFADHSEGAVWKIVPGP